jgi:TRAP-type C4-dicarboxylate transport system substrate-binding protein
MVLWATAGSAAAADTPPEFHVAMLGADGSTWARLVHQWATAVTARAPLHVVLHTGGEAGNEDAMVDALGAGKLDAAFLSTVGLGRLAHEVLALDLPMLFDGDEELDAARAVLTPELDQRLATGGLVRLAWADNGAMYVFARAPMGSAEELAKRKHFSWAADPVGDAFLGKLGSRGRTLEPYELLPALRMGGIDALLASALTVLAMQLHPELHYVGTPAIRYEVGAFVVRKATWDRLPPATQQALREEGARLGERLQREQRINDGRAMTVLVKTGIKPVELPRAALAKAAGEAAAALDGRAWSQAWRLRVEAAAADAHKRRSK